MSGNNQSMKTKQQKTKISRRDFMNGALAAAAFTIVPRHVLGDRAYTAPSDKLNIACIGIGGRGGANLNGVQGENIVALCDVDTQRAGKAFESSPRTKCYTNFRKMLDEMGQRKYAIYQL